jgi:hypothetical protein
LVVDNYKIVLLSCGRINGTFVVEFVVVISFMVYDAVIFSHYVQSDKKADELECIGRDACVA